LAATPVTILLNRGNISDSLLILLLVLAADATTSAYLSGRVGALVLANLVAAIPGRRAANTPTNLILNAD